MKFKFGKQGNSAYENSVSCNTLFGIDDSSDYGFLTKECFSYNEKLKIPEVNDGFEPLDWCADEDISEICEDEHGCYVKSKYEWNVPLSFACKVNPGNYLVTVRLYASKDVSEVLVFNSRRRLSGLFSIEAGEEKKISFVTNVSPIIPRYKEYVVEDTSVNISVIGDEVHLAYVEIEPWSGSTIYIAGDSTVTDQTGAYPYLPERCYSGWGQMLSYFVGNKFAVSNHAHSGLTTDTFRSEGHYDVVRKLIKEGDYCLFQFGHNDQKIDFLAAETGYRNNLVRYVREIKSLGAYPIIVTPLSRNTWKNEGRAYNDLLEDYARVCNDIAMEENVKIIDLHARSKKLICRMGIESVKKYFYPSDYTHSNDFGAFLFAKYIYKGLFGENSLVKKDWIAADSFRSIDIPSDIEGKSGMSKQEPDFIIERPNDYLKRYEAVEFVIKALKYFPTNVYNDVFSDVIGHETYAGAIQCAYQNDFIPTSFLNGDKFEPMKEITGEEFLAYLIKGYKSRKRDGYIPDTSKYEGFGKNKIVRSVAADLCVKVSTRI